MGDRGYDVRAIANILLRECAIRGQTVTNLHLNKALYFMHVDHLRDFDAPLVSAKIEAWSYGPVFREIYNQFKRCGKGAIDGYALKVDFDTGEKVAAFVELPTDKEEYIKRAAEYYVSVPAHILVDVSHAKGGAWDVVFNQGGPINVGMEISNELIRKYEISSSSRM